MKSKYEKKALQYGIDIPIKVTAFMELLELETKINNFNEKKNDLESNVWKDE